MSDDRVEILSDPLEGAGPEKAYVLLLLCAVVVDGEANPAEQEDLADKLRLQMVLQPYASLHRSWLEQGLRAMGHSEGVSLERVKQVAEAAAAHIPGDWRMTVFGDVCDLLLADRRVAVEEQWLIRMLADAFELSVDTVRPLLQLLKQKHGI